MNETVRHRLADWKDELNRLESMMDAELLSPAQREWLGQAIETCQSRIRYYEAAFELEQVKREMEELSGRDGGREGNGLAVRGERGASSSALESAAPLPSRPDSFFACSPDEAGY